MANFFQPGPSQTDTSTTPSPAQQAEQKFRIEMLGRILNSMAGTAPSFASFAAGGPAQRQFPGGFGPDVASLLNAMNQPGAFTSTATQKAQGATPSGISDVAQIAALLGLASQATGFNPLQLLGLLRGVGGGAGNPLDPNAVPSATAGMQPVGTGEGIPPDAASLQSILGAGDPSTLPVGYGVLDAGGTASVDPNYIDPNTLSMLLGL